MADGIPPRAQLDAMTARGVRAKLVTYAQALQDALAMGLDTRTLVEHGIPTADIVLARAARGELPEGTTAKLGDGVYTCDEHDRRVRVVGGRLLHFAGDPSWCVAGEDPDPEPVTCDRCAATSEAGWGDTPLCVDCQLGVDPSKVCLVHVRTFEGAECLLEHVLDVLEEPEEVDPERDGGPEEDPWQPELEPKPDHAFVPEFSAESPYCGALVMRNGGGDTCGRQREEHVEVVHRLNAFVGQLGRRGSAE